MKFTDEVDVFNKKDLEKKLGHKIQVGTIPNGWSIYDVEPVKIREPREDDPKPEKKQTAEEANKMSVKDRFLRIEVLLGIVEAE